MRAIITELLRDFGTINKLPQTSAFPIKVFDEKGRKHEGASRQLALLGCGRGLVSQVSRSGDTPVAAAESGKGGGNTTADSTVCQHVVSA